MIALYIFFILVLLIFIILLLRAGIIFEYNDKGYSVDAKLGPISYRIYPKQKKEKAAKERKPQKKREQAAKPEEKKGGSLSEFKRYWSFISEINSRLRRKLRVDDLTIHFAAGGTDPVTVAMTYGGITAAIGMIIPVLEQNLNIKNRDIETSFSYELKEPYIYAKAIITATVWELIYVGYPLISIFKKPKDNKTGKEEK